MSDIGQPLQDALARYAPAIEAEMRSLVEEPPAPHLARFYGMLAYHLGWRDTRLRPADERTGKWIRPILCLLACEAAGGDWECAVPAAVAIELTHNFTLVHDDIQDGDAERRGRPTVWALWGVAQGINAGDGLFVLARTALHRLYERGVDPATLQHVYQAYDSACLRLVEGQYLDIDFESRLDVGVDEYLTMIRGKTAALLSASLEIGAWIATDEACVVSAYQQFGEELGLTFQIIDDILGLWGDEALTGKSAGNDLRRKKKTLPVVFGFEREGTGGQQPLRTLYQQDLVSDRDVEVALALLDRAGARRYGEDLARKHWQRATDVLSRLTIDTPAQRQLQALSQFLVERTY